MKKEENISKDSSITLMVGVGITFILVISVIIGISKQNAATNIKSRIRYAISSIENLTSHPVLINAVEAANTENRSLSEEDIRRFDTQWQETDTSTPLIDRISSNQASQQLKKFQQSHPDLKEIFITDVFGLNVALTNKTSDYFQADEDWWINTFYHGEGVPAYAGEVEYDESSDTWSHPIYGCIRNGQGEVIGVIKAVLDISQIH